MKTRRCPRLFRLESPPVVVPWIRGVGQHRSLRRDASYPALVSKVTELEPALAMSRAALARRQAEVTALEAAGKETSELFVAIQANSAPMMQKFRLYLDLAPKRST